MEFSLWMIPVAACIAPGSPNYAWGENSNYWLLMVALIWIGLCGLAFVGAAVLESRK
jgi:hypothetical protein